MLKRKSVLILCLILALSLGACATVQLTPQRVYMESQTTYLNAWETYHTVWLAIPDTDARKAEWVQKYHPKFYQAGEILKQFRVDGSVETGVLVGKALEALEKILIELAIKKGGTL